MEKNKYHILVVDDDDKIKELIKQFLVEKGLIVSTASNATEAKEKIEFFNFNLIVLDVMMPGQSGYELTKELKSSKNIPIILLTAKGEAENRIHGLEIGADDYLGKPFEPKELLLRIKNIIRSNSTENLLDENKIGEAVLNLNKIEYIELMVDPSPRRKLAVILVTDVVGYSSMMEENEDQTLKNLKACRNIIEGLVDEHHGSIFNTAGDSILAEFQSAVEAVICGSEFQSTIKERNNSIPEEERMEFRVGINMGDVVIEGENLYGEGVNVAARLEALAHQGEFVCQKMFTI